MAESDVYCNVVINLDELNKSNNEMKSYLLEVQIGFWSNPSIFLNPLCHSCVYNYLCLKWS